MKYEEMKKRIARIDEINNRLAALNQLFVSNKKIKIQYGVDILSISPAQEDAICDMLTAEQERLYEEIKELEAQ